MEKSATEEQPAEVAGTDLGGQVRSAVGRLYRRFRSERPEGSLGDTALAVLTRLHKHGPQTLTELSEHDRRRRRTRQRRPGTAQRLARPAATGPQRRRPGDNRPRHGPPQQPGRLMTDRKPLPWRRARRVK